MIVSDLATLAELPDVHLPYRPEPSPTLTLEAWLGRRPDPLVSEEQAARHAQQDLLALDDEELRLAGRRAWIAAALEPDPDGRAWWIEREHAIARERGRRDAARRHG